MSMNYVGSISILDRGDGPAQAIIDKNKRSVAQRLADETKDELEKVMHRVEDVSVFLSLLFSISLSLSTYKLFCFTWSLYISASPFFSESFILTLISL